MVTLLLILFSIMVVVLIFEGSNQYKKTLAIKDSEENARIALSFVNMKVKQNDIAHRVNVEEREGFGQTIIVAYGGEEEGLFSYIYFKDGALYECYSDGTLSDELSTKIVDVENGSIKLMNDNIIETSLDVNGRNLTRLSAIRSKFKIKE